MQLNIEEMARKAAEGHPDYTPDVAPPDTELEAFFSRFAQLVAAAVKDEAAKAIDARDTGDCTREDMEARRCAAAIRAMEVKT